MLLCDTSGLLALLDSGERAHRRVRNAVETNAGPLLAIDFVLAELDHLLLHRLGPSAEGRFLEQVAKGVFLREGVSDPDFARASTIARRYREHEIGLTDAALMAVAERLRCPVLTLDRHFELFRDRRGSPLTLVPE